MYSTVDGARRFAKKLQRFLAANGAAVTLSQCQSATAKAGGFGNWRELNLSGDRLSYQLPPIEVFHARLSAALPEPASSLVRRWLHGRNRVPTVELVRSGHDLKRWYEDTFPLALAIFGQHRSRTALFRRRKTSLQRRGWLRLARYRGLPAPL